MKEVQNPVLDPKRIRTRIRCSDMFRQDPDFNDDLDPDLEKRNKIRIYVSADPDPEPITNPDLTTTWVPWRNISRRKIEGEENGRKEST